LERIGDNLDQLAARATRAVAELRAQSRSILEDVEAWKQHLDEFRVDAELARMDARDQLTSARAVCRERSERIERRLQEFREESTAAWQSVRGAMDEALGALRATIDSALSSGTAP
jgi:chromosome segregation ATPase